MSYLFIPEIMFALSSPVISHMYSSYLHIIIFIPRNLLYNYIFATKLNSNQAFVGFFFTTREQNKTVTCLLMIYHDHIYAFP